MKAIFKKYKMIAVVAAVLIIPLVYSFMFLYAFFDPYSKLSELPIAIVTEDVGSDVNGTFKNVGNEVVDSLKTSDAVKWVFTDAKTAELGLNGDEFYATITIPKDFTAAIAKADSPERIKGMVVYRLNEKRNFLAGQVMSRLTLELENEISKTISEEIIQAMTDEIKKVPDDLAVLSDGLGEMKEGTQTLYDKTGDLIEGQAKFNEGVAQLNQGIESASAGSTKVTTGAASLAEGTRQFSEALTAGSLQSKELAAGSASFATGMTNFDLGVQKYTQGVSQYVDSVGKSAKAQVAMADSLKLYISAHPEAMKDTSIQSVLKILEAGKAGQAELAAASEQLKASGVTLGEGSQKLSGGYATLDQGIQKISGSLSTAAEKASQIQVGASALYTGSNQLTEGISKAALGTSKLDQSANEILSGEKKLREGIQTLNEGVGEANDEVSKSVTDAKSQVSDLDGINTYAADPVDFDSQKVNGIPNYGTAFTPYFVSLSLWVGSLMMFFAIYLDSSVRFRRSKKESKGFARFAAYTGIGVMQAVILAVALRVGLHLEVKNVALFYMTCIVVALAFVSIMRFLLVHVGEVGKFLAVLLLILQLTACGGTFPMELVPRFFQVVNPWMPMTYSVNALKEIISGVDYGVYQQNILVLLGLAVGFLMLNVGLAKIKTDKNPNGEPIF